MVSVRKAEGVKNEISFLSGYPFRKGSEVKVTIKSRRGDKNFNLFTHEENAWTPSGEEDDALTDYVASFRTVAPAAIFVGDGQQFNNQHMNQTLVLAAFE